MATETNALLNRDVLARDPELTIPNLGVAKVGPPQSAADWDILRYELRNFVCEGAYARGLEQVLGTYLRNLDQGSQPAAWVSGFYGSGKSHFVRVLEALWRNLEFPDGATARDLVSGLSDEISALFRELSTRGRQSGGLWSVGGSLGGSTGASGSVRLALLGIVFEALGLPSQYGPGTFMLWLRQDGYEDQVRQHIAAAGRIFDHEVNNLYVSPYLAKAVLDAVTGFAATTRDVSEALRSQFPRVSDITDDEFLRTLRTALEMVSSKPGEIPLTLIVLDELQQYIGDISERTLQVQNVVEACSSQFGGRLLFVASGQSALQGTPQLFKLRDRFTVRVQLSESDVEEVVRQVVLRKKEDARPNLERLVDNVSPEIDRHLLASRIGARPADRDDLVPDYPLLPVRRRFWEAALRAVDTSGQAGQLRTQLRIVQEATRGVAGNAVGTVIPGDAIFDQIRPDLLQSGELLPDVERTIAQQRQGGDGGGELRARLLAMIFLIGKLPVDGANVPHVLATSENLADLLVSDLPAGSTHLREQVPAALDALVADSILMKQADGQYQMQTRESQDWERDFKGRFARIRNDDARIVGDRDTQLRQAVGAALKSLSYAHGATKERRTVTLHHNATEPPVDSGQIQVWVRDEWKVTEKTVRDEARAAGVESPVIHVFLPRRDADAIRKALASFAAADETVKTRPPSDTPEAQQARGAMLTRVETERQRLAGLIGSIIEGARVFQGGGNELVEGSLAASVEVALEASATRLYPRFAMGDETGWHTVVARANGGNPAPLAALGYQGEVDAHPVCQEIRLHLTGQARKGSEIRQHFSAPKYGWPQDTIYGALLALVADGKVQATLNKKPRPIKELTHTQIGQTLFARETHEISTPQRLAIRKLLQDTVGAAAGDETGGVAKLLQELNARAAAAGGSAPLPATPSTEIVDQLLASHGNAQLLEVHERRNELKGWFGEWGEARDKAQKRMPQWSRLQRLHSHAGNLPHAQDLTGQVEAISANRSLLHDPDPVAPLIAEVTDALRGAVQEARAKLVEARNDEIARLQAAPEWGELDDPRWQGVLLENGMGPVPTLEVGTEAELLRALEQTSLEAWAERTAALPTRAERAREAAAKLLQPTARKLAIPPATFQSVGEADEWWAQLREQIVEQIEQGIPVIV